MNTEWKPIESAPQTGRTLLLGYWNSHGKWRTVRGRWMSLEYIAEHWEDPDEAEAGWFETAVEADDAPNCWAVSPSHWQPMPAPPCPICNDQGAVGNILTAEPCPDCSPPAPTSHPIPTGATGEDDIVQRLRDNADLDAAEDGNPAVIRLEREAAKEIERLRRALADAPAAGDALDAKPDWVACESRRPWVTNSLKASAQKLRDKESRCRTAYTKDFYGIPARYVADAYAEAAAVFESKLAAIAQQSQRKEA